MDTNFWLQRWCEGRTGFHRDQPMPLLLKYWPTLALPASSRVLVPLAGKSMDMLWLAEQGYRVLGVEISPLAVEQFFDESLLQPTVHDSNVGRHHVAGPVEIICGDVFNLDAGCVADCVAVYDRAALIALPAAMRQNYTEHLSRILPAKCEILLITLDYPQAEMEGPPFSVGSDEVNTLYSGDWYVTSLERRDILTDEQRFAARGMSALHSAVYHLQRFDHTVR